MAETVAQTPRLRPVYQIIMVIAQQVQFSRNNKPRLMDLARRIVHLFLTLEQRMRGRWDDSHERLMDSLDALEGILRDIVQWIQSYSQKSPFLAFYKASGREKALFALEERLAPVEKDIDMIIADTHPKFVHLHQDSQSQEAWALIDQPEPFSRDADLCLDYRITRLGTYPVAAGGFADVWEGKFTGSTQKVAIKILGPFSSSGARIDEKRLRRRLWREYLAWSSLSHPNILACLGYSYNFSPQSYRIPSLISPWMENGTVNEYVKKNTSNCLELLVGIAEGLAYLHSREPPIVHGDLRAGNVLVSDRGVPCLCDFGLCRVLEDARGVTTSTDLAGAVRWMSPELLQPDGSVSMHSDIWAYGMTTLEIMSGKRPYAEVKNDIIVIGHIREGKIPSRPQDSDGLQLLSDRAWRMCLDCWSLPPTLRPPMKNLVSATRILATTGGHKTKFDLLREFSLEYTGYTASVHCICFSADGMYLAISCQHSAEIYSTQTGEKTCTLEDASPSPIISICFHPVGDSIVMGSEEGDITIWDISRKRLLRVLDGHHQEIYSLQFSRDGHTFISGSWDGTARIWDWGTSQYKTLSKGSFMGVTSASISPDGRLVATGSYTGIVDIWDTQTRARVECLVSHTFQVSSVVFTPDGKGLVSGSFDSTVTLWDISPFLTHTARSIPLSEDTTSLLTVGQSARGSLCVQEFSGNKEIVRSIAVSSDSKRIACGCKDGSVRFWNLRTGEPTAQIWSTGTEFSRGSINLSSTGEMLATVDHNGLARLWKYAAE